MPRLSDIARLTLVEQAAALVLKPTGHTEPEKAAPRPNRKVETACPDSLQREQGIDLP